VTSGERLADYALAVDRDRFVGRASELEVAAGVLDDAAVARVLYVHGPGGVGKSALLREIGRRARAAGRPVVSADGRAIAEAPESIVELLTPVESGGVLVLIDEVDALRSSLPLLRLRVLDRLPADARVVLAGRAAPDRSWGAGLDDLVVDLPIEPLSDDESRALLRRWGVDDDELQAGILEWAGGSPLGLTVGAQSAQGAAPSSAAIGDRLVRHLAASEIAGIDREVLEVAALTWAVDARLLSAALPGRGTRGAIDELRGLSVVESLGHRVALHPLLAQAIRDRFRADEPERFRAVRRRIAEHLTARALDGDARALHELTNLVENPAVRAGAGLDASRTHSASAFRPDELPAIAAEAGGSAWWDAVAPWLAEAPGFTTLIHHRSGGLAGIAVFLPGGAMPPWAQGDAHAAPALAYAHDLGLDPATTLIGIVPHTPEPVGPAETAEVIRVANTVMITRTGMVNPRHLFAPLWAGESVPVDFLRSLGYAPVPELHGTLAGRATETWMADFGPSGLIGVAAALVAAETGDPPSDLAGDRAELLAAVRAYASDAAMAARSPVSDPDAGRREVLARFVAAWGTGPEDAAARRVLELAYLTPGLGERAILETLHVSRATYYRLLRGARERLLVTGPDLAT
jgi:hypothetical protein